MGNEGKAEFFIFLVQQAHKRAAKTSGVLHTIFKNLNILESAPNILIFSLLLFLWTKLLR
jgi:hypothetical protein